MIQNIFIGLVIAQLIVFIIRLICNQGINEPIKAAKAARIGYSVSGLLIVAIIITFILDIHYTGVNVAKIALLILGIIL